MLRVTRIPGAHDHEMFTFGSHLLNLAFSCILLTIPLFFSGLVFSNLIGKPKINISTALAYNLIGALFGGLMEYNSMYFGFAFLYLLAAGFYLLAWAFSWDPGTVKQPGFVRTVTAQARSLLAAVGL